MDGSVLPHNALKGLARTRALQVSSPVPAGFSSVRVEPVTLAPHRRPSDSSGAHVHFTFEYMSKCRSLCRLCYNLSSYQTDHCSHTPR